MILPLSFLLLKQTPFSLSPLFSDGMVLQRGQSNAVFGQAPPATQIRVEIGNSKATTAADTQGRWTVRLPLIAGKGPYVMRVVGGGETLQVRDVLVGEVWVASGQSNMEFSEAQADDYERAQAEADPEVRFFTVKKAMSESPLPTLSGRWESSRPNTVGKFSAVGLAFARELHERLGVPVGIVQATWGGTPAEAWTSRDALTADEGLRTIIENYDASKRDLPQRMAAFREVMREWVNGRGNKENEGFGYGWQTAEFNDASWSEVPAGTSLEQATGEAYDGSAWYRKTVTLPEGWINRPLKLELGPIDDFDDTYFNGIKVGRTDPAAENPAEAPRVYRIAPGIVRSGSNVIAVRVFDQGGTGGMIGPASGMRLSLADGSESIPLDTEWRFHTERRLDPAQPAPARPFGPGNPTVPSTLFNGMIAPVIPYGIRGVIWYQGEANTERSAQYGELFPTLIRDWRARWGEGDFPFYYVQLPNYLARQPKPGGSDWAALREAQSKALTLPETGMAVAIDLGESDNIHPKAKREVGHRLALQALARTYAQPVVYGSPRFESMTPVGDGVRITFHNGSLTTTDGQPPRGFAIAGEDRRFVWAEARIDGSAVILSSPLVARPVAVRYAWADNPDVNLVNSMGLPTAPFRTDRWPATQVAAK